MHVHFNMEAFERECRAGIAATRKEGDLRVAEGIANPMFLQAQKEFDESRIQFAMAGPKCENAGIDLDTALSAAGAAIGLMIASTMIGRSEEQIGIFTGWINQSIATTFAGGSDNSGPTEVVSVSPVTGGRA